jgi:hypothetical protein
VLEIKDRGPVVDAPPAVDGYQPSLGGQVLNGPVDLLQRHARVLCRSRL